MTKFKLFHLKNEMLIANGLANFIGVFFANATMFMAEGFPDKQMWQQGFAYWVDMLFTPFAFSFVAVMTVLYEKPIRRYLNLSFKQVSISQDLETRARRRLLNAPFVLIALSFSMWLLAAAIYPLLHWAHGSGLNMVHRALTNALSSGIITVTVAFFLLEHILQKKLAPQFFPQGGLTTIPRTLRIRIRTRLVALLFACNLIPLISIMRVLHRITTTQQDLGIAIKQLRSAIYTNAVIFLGVGVFLTILLARNLSIPFKEIVQTLRWVRNGRFDKKVQVTTNDEIGYTGDAINEMTEGLRERERLQQSLHIAKEVQQNLLPGQDPEIEGLDIAGTSIYCEETGGDYYDYLLTGETGQKKICVVVGDVSDHGIPSALLMTTARAFLRQRTSRSGELDQVVADVNLQLTRDVEESGRFMTLFICEVDRDNQIIQWVNAGHDPAIIFDREGGKFDELTGKALPLGVSEMTTYQKFDKKIILGHIIMMGTDGIWETQNPQFIRQLLIWIFNFLLIQEERMDNPIENFWQIRLTEVKTALETNNFEVFLAEKKEGVHRIVLEDLIPQLKPKTISWGGSMTFTGSGLYKKLKDRSDIEVWDTFADKISDNEKNQRRRQALHADLFITGTNAVTEAGQLVNLDMIGNRIAALTFGPRWVIILVGRNKIVPDLEEAMFRVKNYVAPANSMRLDKKTPCVKTSFCEECKSPDRICNSWAITEKSFPKGRTKIILINEDLGL